MLAWNVPKLISSQERRLAWCVALAADAIQIIGLPVFVEGGFSPADTAIDLAAAAVLTRLIGWHWAFLPTLMAEMIPGLDLFPTWTAAVFYVLHQRVRSDQGELPLVRAD